MARKRVVEAPETGEIPAELCHQLDPIWRDPDAIRERFGRYVTEDDLSPLRLRSVYFTVMRGWAEAHGFMSKAYPGFVDWHRLREAGLEAHSLARAEERATHGRDR